MTKIIGVDAAKLAGLQIDHLQKLRDGVTTINEYEWFLGLSKEERDRIVREWKKEVVNKKFSLLKTFPFTVPSDYNHNNFLSGIDRSKFYFFNESITDENFAKTTVWLTPSKTYTVKIFSIIDRVTSQECLDLYRSQRGILTGAQGIGLISQGAKEELPVGKWTVSFDKKETLPLVDGDHRVPHVYRDTDGDYEFYLGGFELDWYDVTCLLVFCDESSDS